jgi:hypothetical protein
MRYPRFGSRMFSLTICAALGSQLCARIKAEVSLVLKAVDVFWNCRRVYSERFYYQVWRRERS